MIMRKELEKYRPFSSTNYVILKTLSSRYLIYDEYLLKINKKGYIPKSGLLFNNVLNENICCGKEILDLGCGYLGILSMISLCNGAKNVWAIDYDIKCVNWFKKIIKHNKINNVSCYQSDYFSKIHKKFDIILSNPPQLPMLENSIHDSGGENGRKHIETIIKDSFVHLKKNGTLYLLCFDFLGTNRRTNSEKSIFELAYDVGYSNVQIVCEEVKEIKAGSETYKNLEYIKKVYPNYDFGKDVLRCYIHIIELRK